MATSFGPYQNNARVWFSYSVGAVGPSSTTALVQVTAYLQMAPGASQYGISGNAQWSGYWGSGSNPQTFNLGSEESVQIVTWAQAVPLGDVGQNLSFAAGANHYFGYTVHSMILWVPPRWARTPTGLTVTRVSDAQQNLNWTRTSTYTSVVVQRRVDDGPWQEIGRPTGNAYAFSDTATAPNHKYEYRVAGIGGSGQSGWSTSATIYTTPAPPSAVTAQKVGSNIEVTATGLPPYATSYTVQESQDGGSFTTLQTGVTTFPWTHTAPSTSVTHTYRVLSVRDGLESAPSPSSNTVQLLAPPNAPTNLTPNGSTVPAGVVRFAWRHTPVDTTAQTAYELRYRLGTGGAWTTLSGTTAELRDITLAASATDYQWQVRTRGTHATYSPWSAVATASVISVPGVAITQPGSSWGQPVLDVTWSWSQAQGRAQSSWQARLLDEDSNLLEERSGTGDAGAVTFNTRLASGQTYIVQVRGATGAVWSNWATQTFTTFFVPPAPPALEAVWVEAQGTHSISLDAGVVAGAPETILTTLERSVDGGLTWEFMAQSTEMPMTLSDTEGLACGITTYRATAYALSGASAQTIEEVQSDSQAIFLGGGAGFARIARLPGDPAVAYTLGRRRAVEEYEGRELPVAYSSSRRLDSVTFGGRIADGEPDWAEGADLEDVAELLAPVHLFRYSDKRLYGSLSTLGLTRVGQRAAHCDEACPHMIWDYSLTLTRTGRE